MKEKLYELLNKKLFDIAILYKLRDLEQYPPADSMPILSEANGVVSQIFDRKIWSTYLDEVDFLKLILSGWFKNEDLERGILEDFSFADSQGKKVDSKWIEENLIIVVDPLSNYQKVGIPKEIALKALTLGHFPDSPFVQKMRENSLA